MADKVWIRAGDVAQYKSFDSPYDAGLEIGRQLSPFMSKMAMEALRRGTEEALPDIIKAGDLYFDYRPAGASITPHFRGYDYISLFWGDNDAQWVRDLTEQEKGSFEKGVAQGII